MRLPAAIFTCLSCIAPAVLPAAGRQEVTVAAVQLSSPSQNEAQVRRALAALEEAFTEAGYSFRAERLTTDRVGELAGSSSVDLFLASGGLYRSLVPSGARDITTLYDPRSSSPNLGIGSNFVVRGDRGDIRSLKDLRGKSVIVTFPNAYTGNAYAMGEIARLGYDPESFFSGRIYRFPTSKIVDSLLAGEADSAVLVTCMLEEMRAAGDPRADRLRVLDPRRDGGLACEHTSMLYPSWTFATTPHATPEILTVPQIFMAKYSGIC